MSTERKDGVLSHPRQDGIGRLDFMTVAKGYVMVRRPGDVPTVKSLQQWLALPLYHAEPRNTLLTENKE